VTSLPFLCRLQVDTAEPTASIITAQFGGGDERADRVSPMRIPTASSSCGFSRSF